MYIQIPINPAPHGSAKCTHVLGTEIEQRLKTDLDGLLLKVADRLLQEVYEQLAQQRYRGRKVELQASHTEYKEGTTQGEGKKERWSGRATCTKIKLTAKNKDQNVFISPFFLGKHPFYV